MDNIDNYGDGRGLPMCPNAKAKTIADEHFFKSEACKKEKTMFKAALNDFRAGKKPTHNITKQDIGSLMCKYQFTLNIDNKFIDKFIDTLAS